MNLNLFNKFWLCDLFKTLDALFYAPWNSLRRNQDRESSIKNDVVKTKLTGELFVWVSSASCSVFCSLMPCKWPLGWYIVFTAFFFIRVSLSSGWPQTLCVARWLWTLYPLASYLPSTAIVGGCHPAWFMWFWRLNPGLRACQASTLPAEPRPASLEVFLEALVWFSMIKIKITF